jgi:uncharacterized protein YlaI
MAPQKAAAKKQHCCTICDASYSQKAGLHNHMQKKHNVKSRYQGKSRYPCNQCKKTFTTENRRKIHERDIHALGRQPASNYRKLAVKQVKCAYCDELFKYWSEHKKHIMVHHNPNRVTMCDHCGSRFLLKSSLSMHLKIYHQKSFKSDEHPGFFERNDPADRFFCNGCGHVCPNPSYMKTVHSKMCQKKIDSAKLHRDRMNFYKSKLDLMKN